MSGSEVLFDGLNASGQYELWAIKPGGSVSQITDVANANTTSGLEPADLTVFGTKVYFAGLDAAGNVGLWETNGTVFEIAHTATGYASTPANSDGMAPTVKAYGVAGGSSTGSGTQAISPDTTGGATLARVGRHRGTGGIATGDPGLCLATRDHE